MSRGELAGLALVVVAVLGGAGLWYVRSLPRPVQVTATPAFPAAQASASVPSDGSIAPPAGSQPVETIQLIVDVTGWVKDPGVYTFDPGARVIDAVDAAGGARDGAELSLLNLAAPLTDGQQVLVPKKGAVPGGTAGGTPGTVGGSGGLINVNTADAATLETLDGIGEVLAGTIVQYREENGPFTSVDQLEEVPGIGPSTLEAIRDQVTV